MRYRKSIYRKNRIRSVLIILSVFAALLFVLFLIVGNILLNRSEESTQPTDITSANLENAKKSTREVNAAPITLTGTSTLSARVLSAKNSGYTDICFELDSQDGTLLYSSSVAQSLGRQAQSSDLWTLSGASGIFKDNGMYSVGITHIKDFLSEDDLARTAAVGYHASLIAEALRAGIDDITVLTDELSPERYKELITLANEVHRLCPDGTLGLSLPALMFAGEHDTLINELWNAFDYIAVNLTTPPEGQTDIVAYTDASLGGMLYYLLRYDVRVLIPNLQDSNISASLTSAIKAKGTQNIQIMPQ